MKKFLFLLIYSVISLSASKIVDEKVSINTIIETQREKYTTIIEEEVDTKKEYLLRELKGRTWEQQLKDLSEYQDLILNIDSNKKIIKIEKKHIEKVSIARMTQEEINKIVKILRETYKDTNIYVYKNTLNIEGTKSNIKNIITLIDNFNDKMVRDNNKYVFNFYRYDSDSKGLKSKIELFNFTPEKKIVIQNPEISKSYRLNIENKSLVVKFNIKDVSINGEVLLKKDIKDYGYQINNWFVEIKILPF